MWAKARFVLGGAMPAFGRALASWKLSVGLMVVAALYYFMLAAWAYTSPAPIVRTIASMAPFWTLYAGLLANTFWCLWKRLPAMLREIGARPVRGHPAAVVPAGAELEAARRTLEGQGYAVRDFEGGLFGVRHRWAALGSYLFHGAFFLVAIGALTTLALREEWKVRVADGEEFTGAPEQVQSRVGWSSIEAGAPSTRFRVQRISPAFWGDRLLFTNLAADLTLEGGALATTRINRPLWLGWGTFLRLSGFGYAPVFEILDREGRSLEAAAVKMNVFPPGQRDWFQSRIFPFRVYARVFPDAALLEGRPTSVSMNLVNPAVQVQVYRGRVDLGGALLRLREPFEVEGLVLRVPQITYWGEFTVLEDPGAPLLFLGCLVGLLGLVFKLPGRRVEVFWSPAAGGAP